MSVWFTLQSGENMSDSITVMGRWTVRAEEALACAERCAILLNCIDRHVRAGAKWMHNGGPLIDASADSIYPTLCRNENLKGPIGKLGWRGDCWKIGTSGYTRVEFTCGAWGEHVRFPNVVSVAPERDLQQNMNACCAILNCVVTAFDADVVEVFSEQGIKRSRQLYGADPVVDWMVYAANCAIPPEALPMVHSVERVGSGTLVILKKERLHLDRPEDLALLDAAEPIIRSFIPPPPAAPPQPSQRAPRTLQ